MPDRKGVSKAVRSKNRRVREESRRKVEGRLAKKHGRSQARAMMRGKDVHKTKGGYLKLVSKSKHGGMHGRGNKGRARAYRRR